MRLRLLALLACLGGAAGWHAGAAARPLRRRAAGGGVVLRTTLESFLQRASDKTLGRSMREIFRNLDTTGNGRLNRKELQEAATRLKLDVSKRDLQRAIYRFDKDADGSLTFVEFVRMLESLLQIPHDEVLQRTGALAQAQRYTTSSLWFHTLLTIPKSTLLRRIWQPVLCITSWSGLIAFLVRFGFVRQSGVLGFLLWPKVHTLLGGALGLLLVFRTNSAYSRMWEGRHIWEQISNLERDLARFCTMYANNMGRRRVRTIAQLLCAYPVLLLRHVSSSYIEPTEEEREGATAAAPDAPKPAKDALSAELDGDAEGGGGALNATEGAPAAGSGSQAITSLIIQQQMAQQGQKGGAGAPAPAPNLPAMHRTERFSTRSLDPAIRKRLRTVSNRPLYICECLGHAFKELYDMKARAREGPGRPQALRAPRAAPCGGVPCGAG